jgi:hypothetical protein
VLERLADTGEAKLVGLLDAGDPRGEVRTTWHAKGSRPFHRRHHLVGIAREFVDQLADDLQDESCPPEVHSLGRRCAVGSTTSSPGTKPA